MNRVTEVSPTRSTEYLRLTVEDSYRRTVYLDRAEAVALAYELLAWAQDVSEERRAA